MKTLTRKDMARLLRNARDLMNNNGDHWIQGDWHTKDKTGDKYCSIGALNKATGSSNPVHTTNSTRELALLIIKSNPQIARKRDLSDIDKYLARGTPLDREDAAEIAMRVIMSWNDNHKTKWEDVKAAFTKAARSLR